MLLEGVNELVQDLILGLLARLNVRVHLSVVTLADIIDIKDAAAILVHDLESLAGEAFSEIVHGATHTTKELVVVDSARAISVEDVEELGRLSRLEADAEVVNGLLELLHAEVARAIVIGNLEGASETHDTAVTALSELLTEALHKLSLGHVHGGSVGLSTSGSTASDGRSSTTAAGTTAGTTASAATRGSASGGSSAIVVASPALLLVNIHGSIKVPGVVHHKSEIFVVIDGGRNVVVVLNPLIFADNVVRSLLVAHGVSSLEGLEELRQDLLLGLLASHDIGVLISRVDATDIVDVDHTRAISVHLGEGPHNDSLAVSVHRTADGTEELVVLNETGAIEIEVSEELLSLTLGEAEHVVRHSLAEFKFVERHGVVVVHDAELLSEANDAAGATGLQLVAKALKKVLTTSLAASRGTTDISAEDLASELTIVESAALVLVVDVVEGIQILASYENKINQDL